MKLSFSHYTLKDIADKAFYWKDEQLTTVTLLRLAADGKVPLYLGEDGFADGERLGFSRVYPGDLRLAARNPESTLMVRSVLEFRFADDEEGDGESWKPGFQESQHPTGPEKEVDPEKLFVFADDLTEAGISAQRGGRPIASASGRTSMENMELTVAALAQMFTDETAKPAWADEDRPVHKRTGGMNADGVATKVKRFLAGEGVGETGLSNVPRAIKSGLRHLENRKTPKNR